MARDRKRWYQRTTAWVSGGIATPVLVGVLTAVMTGKAQEVLGTSIKPSATASPGTSPSAGASGNGSVAPLLRADVTTENRADSDSRIVARPVDLSASQIDEMNRLYFAGNQARDDRFQDYMRAMGAVTPEVLTLDLDLSTVSPDQVRLKNIRVLTRCGPPLSGTLFYSPAQGAPEDKPGIGFDLDRTVPIAQEAVARIEGPAEFRGDFFARHVQYLKKNDGFSYNVLIRTRKHYCEVRLQLDVSANGRSQTVTVDDHGSPFRITGMSRDFPSYDRLYVGGQANPGWRDDQDAREWWARADPRTYGPKIN